jgi:Acyl-CoA thioesterase C-terminal domain/Acyl-CoA thioesterase N-terminal domain
MNDPALFVRDGDAYLADPVCDGPWAPGALHGGAPAALLAHLLSAELDGSGLALARLTCEFVRPAPRGPLRPRIEVVRPGRRVTLIEGALLGPGGEEVTRARALFLAQSGVDGPGEPEIPLPGPEEGERTDWIGQRPMFATDALEITFVEGRFRELGPATAWFRLRYAVVAGEQTRPVDRVAAAADFGNGISSVLSWEEHTFINPDLTFYLERPPVDEWVALRSRMRVRAGSVASAESVLYDRRGRIGAATQSLLVARVAPSGAAT